MRTSVEGIMYPNAAAKALSELPHSEHSLDILGQQPLTLEVPHASWEKASQAYKALSELLEGKNFSNIFVLAPLHKGPIGFEDLFTVYTPQEGKLDGTDWSLELQIPEVLKDFVAADDDICSEEQSLEVLAPCLSQAKAPVTYLLAPGKDSSLSTIVEILRRDFPSALILVSNNIETHCAGMWKEAL